MIINELVNELFPEHQDNLMMRINIKQGHRNTNFNDEKTIVALFELAQRPAAQDYALITLMPAKDVVVMTAQVSQSV
ncbi:hypothetical protein FSARC_2325 [Fusarium sarcochroum]|uniref:Uncharacterized protein n=1 Tax=Fusarium sarcochroum TaxID=1208366 RepID=A0A8H4U6Z1_9HYPO|nr:hypothetical protein FSARC_2325 [Fusarium sarcochroum]